ncbi:flagellar FlbD family protein [Paenibacillus sp. 1P07SE]|uniref:flagellar FlbD family protein n=1 Tax=Paenibacillus sp. 1P07SE TaxID=3132209 RepID=UPI0039A6F551
MITVTRLNHSKVTVNALLVELVEEMPDTLITLTTGKKFVVLESAEQVVEQIQSYLRGIGVAAASIKSNPTEESTR